MACIGEQFCYCVGFSHFVVTTNFSMSIHQHQPGAVYRNSGYIAPIRNRKFEAVTSKTVNRGFRSSKKIPALSFGVHLLCVAAQDFRRVLFRVDAKKTRRKRSEEHTSELQSPL